jgi:hypothetical protein
MKRIVAIKRKKIKIINIDETAHVLKSSNVVTSALFISSTIPSNIINEIPFTILI